MKQGKKKKSPKARFSQQILITGSNRAQRNRQKTTLAADAQRSVFYSKIQDTTSVKINVTEERGVSSPFLQRAHRQKKYLSCISITDGDELFYLSLVLPEQTKALDHAHQNKSCVFQAMLLILLTACLSFLKMKTTSGSNFWVNAGNLRLRSF